MVGLACGGLVAWWALCPMLGWHHGGACTGKWALWVDLARSDRMAVAVDLHVAKMGVAMGLHAVRQRQQQGLVRLEGQGTGVAIMWWRGRGLRTQHVG